MFSTDLRRSPLLPKTQQTNLSQKLTLLPSLDLKHWILVTADSGQCTMSFLSKISRQGIVMTVYVIIFFPLFCWYCPAILRSIIQKHLQLLLLSYMTFFASRRHWQRVELIYRAVLSQHCSQWLESHFLFVPRTARTLLWLGTVLSLLFHDCFILVVVLVLSSLFHNSFILVVHNASLHCYSCCTLLDFSTQIVWDHSGTACLSALYSTI